MQCLPVPAEHSMMMLRPATFRFREDSLFEPQRLKKAQRLQKLRPGVVEVGSCA